jgi:ribosomal protein S27AE
MATQINQTRKYTTTEEGVSKPTQNCPLCKVNVVPKGINSTRFNAGGEKHCPNCGHVFGRANH